MSRVFFKEELEGVATFWRVYRRDGVTLGFVSHDRSLYFGGILHRAAPGMLPSAIRKTDDFSPDSAEIRGPLSHDSISPVDLSSGRCDGARVEVGAVDWEDLANIVLFTGFIGEVTSDAGSFNAELKSAKAQLDVNVVPQTSPTCRAEFCGMGCSLSASKFSAQAEVVAIDADAGRVSFAQLATTNFAGGSLRWLDGPDTGLSADINAADGSELWLSNALSAEILPGTPALLVEGCDHTLATCENRFANSVNFQGEPFLPGNDLLARYAKGK